MKRLMIFVLALVLIGFAGLLQLDVASLYRLVVSGVNDTPIGMYVLWLFPTLFNVAYAQLGQLSVWILVVSDALLVAGVLTLLAGIRYEDTGDRGYHF
jgi:succinate-acetate transporter protein